MTVIRATQVTQSQVESDLVDVVVDKGGGGGTGGQKGERGTRGQMIEQGFCKLLPANKADHMCQSWQTCATLHVHRQQDTAACSIDCGVEETLLT